MRRIAFMAVLFISLVTPSLLCAHVGKTDVVDVRVVSDKGEAFPKYGTFLRGKRDGEYYYLEAVKGQRYSIEVQISQTGVLVLSSQWTEETSSTAKNQISSGMRGCISLSLMVPTLLKGGEPVWTGRTDSTLPSSPIPMPKKYLPMPRLWGLSRSLSTKRKYPRLSLMLICHFQERKPLRHAPLRLQWGVVPPANIKWKRGNRLARDSERQLIRLPTWCNLTLSIPSRQKSFSNTSGTQSFAGKESFHAAPKTDSGPTIWNLLPSPGTLRDDGIAEGSVNF